MTTEDPYERGKLCAQKGYHRDFYNIYSNNVLGSDYKQYMKGYEEEQERQFRDLMR